MDFVLGWRLQLEGRFSHQEEQKEELFFAHSCIHSKKTLSLSRDTLKYFIDKNTLKSAHLKLQFSESNTNRLGIVISKRIVPLSVTRNSLRRRMRGFFRDQKFPNGSYVILLSLTTKIQAEKKIINDILMREWKSLLSQLL